MEHKLLPIKSGLLKIDSLESSIGSNLTLEEKVKLTAKNSSFEVWFSLVLPTYQEGKNIASTIDQIVNLLDNLIPNNYELIVVDDNSPDRTWEKALILSEKYPQLKVMCRRDERCLSTAVIRGWQGARGETLGVMDADLQHPPDILLQLLGRICEGADLAVASRHIKGGGVSDWSFARRLLSRGAQIIGLLILPQIISRVSDPMSGFFVLRRRAIANCLFAPIGYKILIEVIARGFVGNIAEVAYVFQERTGGQSKVTWRQYRDYIHHLLRLRLALLPFSRFVRFCLVGFSGLFVDTTILYLLSDPTTLNFPLIISKFISGEMGIVNNFFWNDRWTFRDVSQRQRGWQKTLKRLLKFNLICLAGLIINVIIFQFLVTYLIPNPYIANFVAIVLTTFWNFGINLKLNWSNSSKS